MSLQIVGLDPGFGFFKAATASAVVALPSVVGVGQTELGLLTSGLTQTQRPELPDTVTMGEVSYLVGAGVAQFARPVERMDFQRLSEGPELRALCYATLGQLLGPGTHRVALMVGLPVEVMANHALAQDTLHGLQAWLLGQHQVQINHTSLRLEVVAIKVMAQPAGAFFAWGLSPQGAWARLSADLEVPVAICDIGYNTIDLFAVSKGRVMARYTNGDTQGMRRAAEVLVETVRRRYSRTLSLHEADTYLRDPAPLLPVPGGQVDLSELVQQALDTMIGGALALIERHWGRGRDFGHLLFAGGGPAHPRVGQALLGQYPHGIILPQSGTANAVGLARYGLRAFREQDDLALPTLPRTHSYQQR